MGVTCLAVYGLPNLCGTNVSLGGYLESLEDEGILGSVIGPKLN